MAEFTLVIHGGAGTILKSLMKPQMELVYVVHDKLLKINGEGGMIGVDALGNGEMIFNSEAMYRAIKNSKGLNEIGIYQ